jgi:hypothetical membrane protein
VLSFHEIDTTRSEASDTFRAAAPKRRIRTGGVVWALSVQFFVAQAVVQSAWTTPFSLAHNYISDLGNTTCGLYPRGAGRYVCSPWHAGMNASFVLQGLIMAAGMMLVRTAFPAGMARLAGSFLLVAAGLGNVAVGLFPEDVNIRGHELGAAVFFVFGNAAMIALGVALGRSRRRPALAFYSLVSGVVGESSTWLFIAGHDGGLGVGGMERVAAYALPVWLMVIGIAFAKSSPGGREAAALPERER